MTRCPLCDHFNPEEARACERCGAALPPAAARQPPERPTADSLDAQVLTIAATGGKIAAIKWHRQQTGLGLKESKVAVERLMKQHNVTAPKSGCAGMLLLLALATAGLCTASTGW
jgi:ribosomal protein L7/L12